VLVGINPLREGLDIPECALVAILDADKEGFLRSKTSLIQTIGRAARNVDGRVLLYADTLTRSLSQVLEETNRRRDKQQAYNQAQGITPASVHKSVFSTAGMTSSSPKEKKDVRTPREKQTYIASLEKQMLLAASDLDFEKAARIRDLLKSL